MPESDEKKFNETLKRMLKTPPTPHVIVENKTNHRDAPSSDNKRVTKNGDNGTASG